MGEELQREGASFPYLALSSLLSLSKPPVGHAHAWEG
jgi:hypothetical protein